MNFHDPAQISRVWTFRVWGGTEAFCLAMKGNPPLDYPGGGASVLWQLVGTVAIANEAGRIVKEAGAKSVIYNQTDY